MRVVFIGTGEIGVPTLQSFLQSTEHKLVGVVTQPDKPAGRAKKLTAPAIKIAVLQTDIPILQPPRIKSSEAVEQIRGWEPDVMVVMAYGQILPRGVLELPRIACLNLHASLLPRHRGAAPIQAAIVAGDPETGITVMYMDEGLDTGDILLQKKLEMSPNETGGSLHDRLAEIAPDALNEALRLLGNGNAPKTPQDSTSATYAPKLSREDGKIDWSEPAAVIERKIRAFNPWPGAFTQIAMGLTKPRNLKIFSAAVVDLSGKPGEILRSEKELVIAAADHALSLAEVQIEGKRKMNASALLRGIKGGSAAPRAMLKVCGFAA